MDGSVVLAVLRLLVSLGVVLTLLVLLARWARRRGLGGTVGARTGVEVELLSRRALGRGSALHVVQVGEEVLVLGVTDQHVSLIQRLDPEAVRVPVPAAEPAAATPAPEPAGVPAVALPAVAAAVAAPAAPVAAAATVPVPLPDFAAVLAARAADPELTRAIEAAAERTGMAALAAPAAPTAALPATRAERRALERSRPGRAHRPATRPSSPAARGRRAAPAQVPTGWPWSAATVVVGALKGGRA